MNPDDPAIELTWKARNVRPAILLYVGGVSVVFIAIAHFLFRSTEAVEALLLAAMGSVGALIPNLLTRVEYRLTDSGLSKRRLRANKPGEF
jgi:hypothetical protein